MEEMQAQAEHVGTRMLWDHIDRVELNGRPFRLHGDSGTVYLADTLVIADRAPGQVAGLATENG
jgi:thioredoxin reductase (NADPH)